MHRTLLLMVWAPCALMAQSEMRMGQIHKRAQALFVAGKCDQVIELGSHLEVSNQVDDIKALALTEAIVARCFFQRGETKSTEDQLRSILFLKPDFELDAFETPRPLLDLFNRLKSDLAQKTRELQRVKETAHLKADVLESKISVRKMSPLAPLVPFGFAQFEYNANIKGIIVASLEAGFLAANIACFWAKRSLTSSDASSLVEDQNALSAHNLLQGFQFAFLGLFAAVYAFGAIDGYLHKDDVIFVSSHTQSRKLSHDEFLRRLQELKKRDEVINGRSDNTD